MVFIEADNAVAVRVDEEPVVTNIFPDVTELLPSSSYTAVDVDASEPVLIVIVSPSEPDTVKVIEAVAYDDGIVGVYDNELKV